MLPHFAPLRIWWNTSTIYLHNTFIFIQYAVRSPRTTSSFQHTTKCICKITSQFLDYHNYPLLVSISVTVCGWLKVFICLVISNEFLAQVEMIETIKRAAGTKSSRREERNFFLIIKEHEARELTGLYISSLKPKFTRTELTSIEK